MHGFVRSQGSYRDRRRTRDWSSFSRDSARRGHGGGGGYQRESRAGSEITEEAWDRIMAVNVKGLWLCSKAVVPAMQQRKQGSVVNISSNMAFNGGQGMMHYVVSKATVVGFSRVLAREIVCDNIRVNTLAPGSTMSEEKPTEEALKNYERTASTRILKRIEQPEDLVGTALYLLSDLSSFVTGQVILVNGGAVLH
jgi:3-oxoacyl-[acyl-carrier protein] reductase